MLDISFICNQNRENLWLKETLFSKVDINFLNENYKKVLSPFVDYEKTN